MKAEDLDAYRESYKSRIKKSEQKKKDEDLDGFRKEANKRKKKKKRNKKLKI